MSQEFGEKGTKKVQVSRTATGFYTRLPAALQPDESQQMVYMDWDTLLNMIDFRVLQAQNSMLNIASEVDTLVILKGSITRNGSDYTVAANTYGFIGDTWYAVKAGTLARTGANYMTLAVSTNSETQETDYGFKEVELANGATGSGVFDVSATAADDLSAKILEVSNAIEVDMDYQKITTNVVNAGKDYNTGFYSHAGTYSNMAKDNVARTLYTFQDKEYGLFAVTANLNGTNGMGTMLVMIRTNSSNIANNSTVLTSTSIGSVTISMSGLDLQFANNNFASDVKWSITKLGTEV